MISRAAKRGSLRARRGTRRGPPRARRRRRRVRPCRDGPHPGASAQASVAVRRFREPVQAMGLVQGREIPGRMRADGEDLRFLSHMRLLRKPFLLSITLSGLAGCRQGSGSKGERSPASVRRREPARSRRRCRSARRAPALGPAVRRRAVARLSSRTGTPAWRPGPRPRPPSPPRTRGGRTAPPDTPTIPSCRPRRSSVPTVSSMRRTTGSPAPRSGSAGVARHAPETPVLSGVTPIPIGPATGLKPVVRLRFHDRRLTDAPTRSPTRCAGSQGEAAPPTIVDGPHCR